MAVTTASVAIAAPVGLGDRPWVLWAQSVVFADLQAFVTKLDGGVLCLWPSFLWAGDGGANGR